MSTEQAIRQKFLTVRPFLDERTRRCWAAAEAKAIGWGGVSLVAKATRMHRDTIARGLQELDNPSVVDKRRLRRPGAGRKSNVEKDPSITRDLAMLVDPATRGDPESPLKYTSKSLRKLSEELIARHHQISHELVAKLLHIDGYSLQANKKTREGKQHPDRDAQFIFINDDTKLQLALGEPVISVDTKKKELIGNFKNAGREWSKKGEPVEVQMHDFKDPTGGKAVPYGIYDLVQNNGWINVGIDHDTAAFAVESIRQWWRRLGAATYPHTTTLTITADSGGSNSYRSRLWKCELQHLADETQLTIRVRHFPPGTSKWNKIEHRLFSFISKNWRATPLRTLATIINLIGATTSKNGLKVYARLDTKKYPKGVKVSEDQLATVKLEPEPFHGEWNYSIKPRNN